MADPFLPKFVDLVRNIATSVGTGNFTLGPAVVGYTSFTAALQVGDSFYYSIIGVDKPDEHEVGRGTLLAGGAISRSAIGGTNTNFSAGTKSVALIAAAEWFARAEQLVSNISNYGLSLASSPTQAGARGALGLGSAAVESVSRFTVTIADRTSLAAYSATSTAYLQESGREGVFVWDASDQSAKVASDTFQGIYVAAAMDPTGASGAWVRKYSGPISVKWFGAMGDGATDDGAAFIAALAYLKAIATNLIGYYKASPRLFVPMGHYYLGTTTIDLTHTLIIEGDGTGMAGTVNATKLRWAAGASGIRVQRYDTSGVSSVDNVNTHTGGDGTILRGLHLVGGYSGTEGEFHGVHAKARVAVENCKIENFQGDGIYANVAAGSGGANEGNANIARVIGVSIIGCRNGIFLDGADTNIWTVVAVDSSSNRRWGIWDSSFLGNSYFGCHSSANGWTVGSIPSLVSYAGNRYCVKKDQGVGASTNAPSGTTADNSWWYYAGPGGPSSGINIDAWASGTTYRDGGSYRGDGGGNANNLFAGCYHEGGQGFAQLDPPALVAGGSMRPNVRGVASMFGGLAIASDGNLSAAGNISALGANHTFGPQSGAAQNNAIFLDNTNSLSMLQGRHFGGGTVTNIGVVEFSYGFGNIYDVNNPGWRHRLRVNGTDIAVVDATGLTVSGAVMASGAMGYGTGAGGAVTQLSSKASAVTLNKSCGQITTASDVLAADAAVTFTVNNSQVAATDCLELVLASGNASPGTYSYQVDKVSAGSFLIWLKNISADPLSEALVFNFAVKKAVAA